MREGGGSDYSQGVLARVAYVEESVLVLVLLVNGTHEGGSGRENLVDKDEDGLFRGELDPLSDNVDKLTDGEILWSRARARSVTEPSCIECERIDENLVDTH